MSMSDSTLGALHFDLCIVVVKNGEEMRVSSLCLILLVLCPRELDCRLQWQLPGAAPVGGGATDGNPPPPPPPQGRQRREARWRRITVSKTSRDAVGFGLRWATWRQTHSKTYSSSSEALARYVVWRSNIAYIESHNSYADNFGFTLAINSFGDLTSEEYIQSMRCVESHYYHHDDASPRQQATPLSPKGRPLSMTYFNGSHVSRDSLPDEVDWRTQGAITEVKDQGRCRSCYAFAMMGAVEAMHAMATGELLSLSEQNIIDCSIPYGNRGCSGGSRLSTVMYMVDNGGVDTSKSYPYIGRQYLCRFSEEAIGSECTGVVRIKHGREQELQKAVAVVGPVTVAIDSRHTSFQFYSDGVYSEPSCSRSKLTHTLLVVGYGRKHGRDYWLLKNSWGTSWGQDGYIMMTRNYANQCGIASKAMYITI